MKHAWLMLGLVVCALLVGGCARAARDTTGFAITDRAVIEAPHEDAWQMTKAVLREEGLDIYTRDKRGTFVAYTPMKRGLFQPRPQRTEFTFELDDLNNNTTELTATTLRQVYGVTLLTYPGWHDRKTADNSQTLEMIQAVQAKAAGGFAQPVIEEHGEPSAELGRPNKRGWYRRLNPGTWFKGKETGDPLTIQEQQGPAMADAPAKPADEAVAQPVEAGPRGETSAPGEEAPAERPRDDESGGKWYKRLNPKSWF